MCEKNKISQKLKNNLWDLHFIEDQNKCKCCNINYIKKIAFVAGHIYPEICGGKIDLYNLLPICLDCNKKMGQQYLLTYAKSNNYGIVLDDNYKRYQDKIKELECFGIKFNNKSLYLLNKIDSIITYLIINNYIDVKWNIELYKDVISKNKEIKLDNLQINNIQLETVGLRYNLIGDEIIEISCCIYEKETDLLRGLQYKMFIYFKCQSKKNYKLKNYDIYIDLYFTNVK